MSSAIESGLDYLIEPLRLSSTFYWETGSDLKKSFISFGIEASASFCWVASLSVIIGFVASDSDLSECSTSSIFYEKALLAVFEVSL